MLIPTWAVPIVGVLALFGFVFLCLVAGAVWLAWCDARADRRDRRHTARHSKKPATSDDADGLISDTTRGVAT
ncbi:hypothetical protein [Acrocarpospora catenulata]|uniref:hypothetical protein n=1 Tax=Acrocarpospora catenulata TaxID=2836182 RepID=UPI001BDAD38A|nr:hypothetical protein [Acrocarpospora catenulata]